MSKLSTDDMIRYGRHFTLPEFGEAGQNRLLNSSVLVVGCGGLGAPILQYLVAAGIGRIGIVDDDKVEASNLHRQVLFDVGDIGRHKVDAARDRLSAQNPSVNIETFRYRLESHNAIETIKGFDIVADGSDNFPTRYLVNDACVKLGKVNVYASVFRFEGQVSVFNLKEGDGYGPNFRDLFPEPPPAHLIPSCAEAGILGVLPGIIGAIQGLEVIKVAASIGRPLSGRMLVLDSLSVSTHILNIQKDPKNPVRTDRSSEIELIDYEAYCGRLTDSSIRQIHPRDVNEQQHWLLDVRTKTEVLIDSIGGYHIPKNEIEANIESIPRDREVIVYCESGRRSSEVISQLVSDHGFDNLLNLEGGIVNYRRFFPK